jgi:hypothetical protein
MHTKNAASGAMTVTISHEYSSVSPFNIDNTRLLLGHQSYFALYDGAGNYLRDLWPNPGILGSSEPRWSKKDPNEFYYISGNRFMKYNVGTNAITTVHTFPEYASISGKGEEDISADGDHFAFAGDSRYVFLYEISTDTKGAVLDAGAGTFDSLYITPNNNVIVGYYATGSKRFNGFEVYNRNMQFQRQLTHVLGHQDVTLDTNGEELLVWANGADPNPPVSCPAGIVKVRISDAKQTCIWNGPSDWSNASHISAPDNSGWVIIETYDPVDIIPPTGWMPQTDEIILVKLDGSECRRLLHHRSRPLNTYTYQPKASISHDGTKLVYASNYGLQRQLGDPIEYSDEYLVDLSAVSQGTGGSAGSPTGGSTGGGSAGGSTGGSTSTGSASTGTTKGNTGGTTTTGSTSGSTTPTPTPTPTPIVTRVQQNAPGVTYSGAWSTNNAAFNSGGSAALTMSAGAKVNLAFNGTGVSWIGYRDEWSGIAKVYVDGALRSTVDTYSTPGKAQTSSYSISGLPAGSHSLTIEATGTKSAGSRGTWVWVDAFDVLSGGSTTTSGSTTSTTSGTSTGTTTSTTPATTSCASTPIRVEQNAPAVSYTGTWAANGGAFNSGGSAVLAAGTGARAVFKFTGCGARWIAYGDEWSGIANVYVDGVLKATVDTSTSPAAAKTVMYTVTGLAYGAHTLTIEVTGRKSVSSAAAWIWVDAFDYY